jgi:hypothetical protein
MRVGVFGVEGVGHGTWAESEESVRELGVGCFFALFAWGGIGLYVLQQHHRYGKNGYDNG